MRDIQTRLELLEASRRQDPLILLCVDSEGNQKKMSVSEMLQSDNFGFVRVVGGSRLSDLDLLLAAFREKALQAFDGGADDG